jgi:hypothetical protein
MVFVVPCSSAASFWLHNSAQLAIRVKSMLGVRHLTNELERELAYIEELVKDLPKA